MTEGARVGENDLGLLAPLFTSLWVVTIGTEKEGEQEGGREGEGGEGGEGGRKGEGGEGVWEGEREGEGGEGGRKRRIERQEDA